MKRNNKAFTLIELLAVIIILALLMAIAIPMVSKYIEQSRKKTHIRTAAAFVDGLTREIVSNNVPLMADSDSIYYIPFNCIPIEKGGTSPHGSWEFAYVLMTYDSGNRNYYIYSKDAKGMGIEGVEVGKLKVSDVKSIDKTKDDLISVEGKTISQVVGDTCDYSALITKNVDGNPAGIQPDDSCFEFSAGIITYYNWWSDDTCPLNIEIPSTINGESVTSIGSWAFTAIPINSLIIPNSVTSIGRSSFMDCTELTSVNIPNSVTSLGDWAFAYSGISDLVLSENLTSIGVAAFGRNQLPEEKRFIYNRNPDSSIDYTSINSFAGAKKNNVIIPEGVTTIGESAFDWTDLESVIIPNSVTSIGAGAFENNQLSSVSIPNSVTSIGSWAFSRNQLTNISIPNSVTSIGQSAFYQNQLSSVNIPDSVTSIEGQAFYRNQLSSVNIPDSVTSIGIQAFSHNQLSSVIIPSSVSSIGSYTFSNNPLGTITMQGRENTTGMTLGTNWNGSGTIVFAP